MRGAVQAQARSEPINRSNVNRVATRGTSELLSARDAGVSLISGVWSEVRQWSIGLK